MRSWRLALTLVCVVLLALAVVPSRGEEKILNEVPSYYWTHGCSPTAGAMIMGYWDTYGYSGMIPGSNRWSTNQSAIRDAIASPEHVADYALYDGIDDMYYSSPYTDKSELGGAHADNSLADFMLTSRSSEDLTHGATWTNEIGIGMENYTSWRGYSFTAGGDYSSIPKWTEFTHEILMGRPVKLSVDSDGDGNVDHSVTAIGFRNTYGIREYACRDTWSTSSTPRWERFRRVSVASAWGIDGMDTFRPGGTPRDTMWTSAGGNWQDSGWSTGLPDSSAYACITDEAGITISADASAGYVMNRGTMDIQGGTFTVGTLASAGLTNQSDGSVHASGSVAVGANGAYILSGGALEVDSELDVSGEFNFASSSAHVIVKDKLVLETGSTFTAVPSATIHMTGSSFENESTNSSNLAGLGNLKMVFEGGSEVINLFEAAGENVGAVIGGFVEANFLLDTLQLGEAAAGRIQLVDDFDNQSDGSSVGEAVYVNNLIMNAGATIDLSGLNLYYFNDGGPKRFFCGDADVGDLGILAGSYGQTEGMVWAGGDFTGDGAVNVADLGVLAANYGVTGSAIPEPASATMLLLGTIAVLRRRKK